jgi:hypothetical protein
MAGDTVAGGDQGLAASDIDVIVGFGHRAAGRDQGQ